jgi:hypothetical protein
MTGELEIVLKSSTQNGKFFALGYIINIIELIIISLLPDDKLFTFTRVTSHKIIVRPAQELK